MKDLEKMLMSKKSKGSMDEKETQAKMDVLHELLQMAQEAMGSKVKGGMDEMKKVSVMAPDTESLTKGLDMAKHVAEDSPEMEAADEDKEEAMETPKEKMMEMMDPHAEEKEESKEAMSPMEDEEEHSLFSRKPKKRALYGNEE